MLIALLAAASAGATVAPINRADILSRAQGALGYSYYWGHGSWSPGGVSQSAGTCAGNCPNCTHAGRYGADCSGYACKVWSLPSTNADVTIDEHPYSTADLINAKAGYWGPVADADLKPGDARVFRTATEGHVYLIRTITGAGRFTTLEAKGCAYGILSLTRSDAWTSQRRAQVVEPTPLPPDTPEQPNGPQGAVVGQPTPYCTRATSAQGGQITDSFFARNAAGTIVAAADAPAALAGAEMCVALVFPSAGHFNVGAKASNGAGTSAESAPLPVVASAAGGTDGGTQDGGGADAGTADAGAHDGGPPDAGHADAGGTLPDAGPPLIDGGDEGDPGTPVGAAAKQGCGGCGGSTSSAPALALLAIFALRRRRRSI